MTDEVTEHLKIERVNTDKGVQRVVFGYFNIDDNKFYAKCESGNYVPFNPKPTDVPFFETIH